MSIYVTPTFITEPYRPVTYVQLFQMTVKVKGTAYTGTAYTGTAYTGTAYTGIAYSY